MDNSSADLTPKEQLAAAIEAYAAAASTHNNLLIHFATSTLNKILSRVDITVAESVEDGAQG